VEACPVSTNVSNTPYLHSQHRQNIISLMWCFHMHRNNTECSDHNYFLTKLSFFNFWAGILGDWVIKQSSSTQLFAILSSVQVHNLFISYVLWEPPKLWMWSSMSVKVRLHIVMCLLQLLVRWRPSTICYLPNAAWMRAGPFALPVPS